MSLHFACWQEWSQWNPRTSWNWRTFNLIGLEIEYYTYKGRGIEVTVELLGFGMNIEWVLKPYQGGAWADYEDGE